MTKSKISSSVIKKIKNEKITQHSKSYFFAKFLSVMIAGILFFILGIIASAILWHFFSDTELLEIFAVEKKMFLKALWLSFPIFWVLLSVGLGILASILASKSKKGYRTPYKWWLAGIVLIQVFLGFVVESSPLGEHLEHDMLRKIHILKSRENGFQDLWQNPDKGLLIGEVTQLNKDHVLLLDWQEKKWKVFFRKKRIPREILPNQKIRLVGKQINDFEFMADKVLGMRFKFKRPYKPERTRLQNSREFPAKKEKVAY